MNSPELLLLVENCPKGAETLVTRCLHSLTDKGAWGPAFSLLSHLLSPTWARAAASLVAVPSGLPCENHMRCI